VYNTSQRIVLQAQNNLSLGLLVVSPGINVYLVIILEFLSKIGSGHFTEPSTIPIRSRSSRTVEIRNFHAQKLEPSFSRGGCHRGRVEEAVFENIGNDRRPCCMYIKTFRNELGPTGPCDYVRTN